MKKYIYTITAPIFFFGWLILNCYLIPPSFGGSDIYYFKDAGINWAEGMGLVSRFTFGNPTFEYKTYSQYPPLYPLIFGIFVKIFGLTPQLNELFNSFISSATGLMGFYLLRKTLFRNFNIIINIIFLIISIIFGYFINQIDRPDSLAVFISLIILVLLNSRYNNLKDIVIGALCGLNIFISPYTGIWIGFSTLIIVMTELKLAHSIQERGKRLLIIGTGFVLAILILITILMILLPDWIKGFSGVVTGVNTKNETGGGYFIALITGDYKTWISGIPKYWLDFYVELLKLLIIESILIVNIIYDTYKNKNNTAKIGMLMLCIFSPMCVVLIPYQIHYITISTVLLLSSSAVLANKMPKFERKKYVLSVFLGFFTLTAINLPWVIRGMGVRIISGETIDNAYRVIQDVAASNENNFVAVAASSYILWREKGLHPLYVDYSGFNDNINRSNLSYIGLSYPGSGNPSQPSKPKWFSESDYELINSPYRTPEVSSIGFFKSRSTQTWVNAVYKKNNN